MHHQSLEDVSLCRCSLTGEEEQIGGFDLVYKNGKRIKNGLRNLSFLGCLNNRQQQMPKMAKTVALKLAEKVREDKAAELRQQQKNQNNKNIRNKSTNIPSNQHLSKQHSANQSTNQAGSNNPPMNKSGNVVRRMENGRMDNGGNVKLPKVGAVSNSSVSNSSMKAIWEGGGKRSGHEGGSKEEKRK